MTPDSQTDVVRRLRCAAGHLNAVIEMAEDGQPCEYVLHQLSAVEAALRAAGVHLINAHVQASEAVLLENSSPAQRTRELKKLLSLYAIMVHQSHSSYEVTK